MPLWNYNLITTIQQHLNIMRTTYELQTLDAVGMMGYKNMFLLHCEYLYIQLHFNHFFDL